MNVHINAPKLGVTVQQNLSMETGFGNPVARDSEITSVSAETLPAGSDATASYVSGALTLGIPKGDKGDTGSAGADAVVYVLEPSVGAVVYDPNAEEGSRLNPSSVTVSLYKYVNGARNDTTCNGFTITAVGETTAYEDRTGYIIGQHSHTFTLQNSIDGTYHITFSANDGRYPPQETYATVSIPVISRGINGAQGEQGIQGVPGPKGDKGDTGATGAQGPKGDTGATGPQGSQGEKGDKGDKGDTGTNGTNGVTFTPSVSSVGVISWTNDGNQQNPQSVDLCAAVFNALPTWNGGNY